MFLVDHVRNFYGRFERPISSFSLIAGFIFDAVTLKRVDTLWENFWVFAHIIIVGLFIILIHTQESKGGDEQNPEKRHFWYVNILQFFFGGLLSTYLVFYFRSADIFVTWPFILLLAIAFIANESFKRHYIRFSFQIILFFLSVYSFSIFLLPVVTHTIGPEIFILSGFATWIFIVIFVALLVHFSADHFQEDTKIIFIILGAITLLINFLYFTNLIPPIPLSLKDGGMYHSVVRDVDGNYMVTYENDGWKEYFKLYKDVTVVNKGAVYAYSSIFSPTGLDIIVIHEWQYYDAIQKKWITNNIVQLPVMGGRAEGFRTYSFKRSIVPGRWRVNIKTESGQIIGRLRFVVNNSDSMPPLKSDLK
jgi:hypothetical protein